MPGTRWYNFQPCTPKPNPDSHNAQRHRQTDSQTDDVMLPIADHTLQRYDRLKKAHDSWPLTLVQHVTQPNKTIFLKKTAKLQRRYFFNEAMNENMLKLALIVFYFHKTSVEKYRIAYGIDDTRRRLNVQYRPSPIRKFQFQLAFQEVPEIFFVFG